MRLGYWREFWWFTREEVVVDIVVSGGGGFDDHKGFGGFQGSEHSGKKLSVVFGESLVRSFLGKVFQWLDISCRSR